MPIPSAPRVCPDLAEALGVMARSRVPGAPWGSGRTTPSVPRAV
jgi:hypothetical protein